MDTHTKQLIAIGAAAGANCIPCLRGLVEKARHLAIGEDEIRVAVGVGQRVRVGAANAWDDEARALIGESAHEPCPITGAP